MNLSPDDPNIQIGGLLNGDSIEDVKGMSKFELFKLQQGISQYEVDEFMKETAALVYGSFRGFPNPDLLIDKLGPWIERRRKRGKR